ncbi:SufE family protein [Carboxylicivirga mesophila]|uniref:SufE family protein n=2 Tax=Carboxylicivirga TaxID=1628153 RepID=A0A941EZE2_9BACT|nr:MULTISPECIES: SufE family protein [Carboxylicivirga]MBR8534296.1 SufE family protein [Carboxylicivirga sediminis]MBS2210428.1 SufE family protein [Carboxylicivirga mesophila]
MTINEIQEEIIEEFAAFDEWMDKYSYLIEIGNDLEGFKDEWRLEQNLIEGCQSKVWVHAELQDDKIIYSADSDAIITKGIIALLIRVLSGRTPDEILNSELNFVEEIGLKDHLSPTRSNGLLAMMKQMRLYAVAFKAKLG